MPKAPVLFDAGADSAPWRKRAKQTEAGRLVAALYRRRKLPGQLWRARPLRGPEVAAGTGGMQPERRTVKAICWISAGPGSYERVLDTWASVKASSPGDGEVALLVVDDWTHDCTAQAITAQIPDAVVVRTPFPTVGAPRLWPVMATALRAAQRHFDYELILKFDDDALAVGPGVRQAVAALLTEQAESSAPSELPVGLVGPYGVRPDGELEGDEPYHTAAVAAEERRDRTMREWAQRARANGWREGSTVQGGAMALTRPLVDAFEAGGAFEYVPRLRTIMSDDITVTVAAYAFGFRALEAGGPSGPYAFANKHLPLPLERLLDPDSPWLVAHSTRVGMAGEPEAEIRSRVRAARAQWPT